MLMPECKAIMETFAKKRNPKTATKESRVISLHRAVDGTWKHRLFDEFLVRTGLATRADFIEALACESDSSCIADLKLWLDRLEPHWRNQPKMTLIEAQALWETDQRCPVQDWSIQTDARNGSLRLGNLATADADSDAPPHGCGDERRRRRRFYTPSVSRSSNSDPRSPASRCMCFARGWWLMGLISGGRHNPWTPRARAVLD
jgi:hypothetical protein